MQQPVACTIFVLLLVKVQFAGGSFGWPAAWSGGLAVVVFDFLVGLLILRLAMIPLGYDSRRSFSMVYLFLLMIAGGLASRFIFSSEGIAAEIDSYAAIDKLAVFTLCTMMIFGVIEKTWRWCNPPTPFTIDET